MKKIILAVVLTLSMISIAGATDIIITIPDAVTGQVVASIEAVHPNTECEQWDLTTVTCVKKKYNNIQWTKKIIRDLIKDVISTGQNKIINDAYAAKQLEIRKTEEVKITTGESVDNYLTIK